MTAHEPEPWGGLLRLSQPGEVERQWPIVRRLIERRGGYVLAVEQGMTDEDIMAAIRQQVTKGGRGARYGWLPGIYWDLQSGYKRNAPKPGRDRCFADAERGVIKGIAVFDVDRLTRDPDKDNARILELNERHGIKLASHTGEYDLATSGGRFSFRIDAARARRESEQKTERLLLWHAELAAQGVYTGTRRPFGYHRIPAQGQRGRPGYRPASLEVNEDEAPLVKEAVMRVLAGWSLRRVCLDWTNRQPQVRTTMGGLWTPETLRQFLVSPLLVGWREHSVQGARAQIVRDDNGHPVQAWPGIITADLHDDLVDMLSNQLPPSVSWPSRRTNRGRTARVHLLSSFLECGACGQKMVGLKRGRDRQAKYVCPGRPRRCRGTVIDAALVDRLFLEFAWAWIDTGAVRSAITSAAQGSRPDDGQDGRRRQLEADLARFDRDYRRGKISAEDREKFRILAKAELEEVKREQAEQQEGRPLTAEDLRVILDVEQQPTSEELRLILGLVDGQDPTGTLEGRRLLVTALAVKGIVGKATRRGNRPDPFRIKPIWVEGLPRREAGTIWRRLQRQAWQASAKTECPNRHPWDKKNTLIDPKRGVRICRACKREQSRRRRADARTKAAAPVTRICAAADCDRELPASKRADAEFCSPACSLREWRHARRG
jgi:site-specific DNA recombinase